MLNLLITSEESAWKVSPYMFIRNRCLTEYILPEFKEQFGGFRFDEIERLKRIPAIFTYEQYCRKDAHIGWITDISVRQKMVRIDFRLTGDTIRFNDFVSLAKTLDMGHWELDRTHWTIKNVSIEELRPYFSTNMAQKPSVFVSYSWTPIENQRKVFELVERLESDGIRVVYDKKDLRPGQDKDYFMENALSSHDIDFVLVVCNKDYAEKANARRGGVGYETEIIISQIDSQPLQIRYIPVVIETDESGTPYIPLSLKSRFFIDLTEETGYSDLISTIKAGTP